MSVTYTVSDLSELAEMFEQRAISAAQLRDRVKSRAGFQRLTVEYVVWREAAAVTRATSIVEPQPIVKG